MVRADIVKGSQKVSIQSTPIGKKNAGVVYIGEHCTLKCNGIAYYLISSKPYPEDYIFTSPSSQALSLELGLAICKALELYEAEDVKRLYGKQKQSGFVTSYFSQLVRKFKNYVQNEKNLILAVVDYNEKILSNA